MGLHKNFLNQSEDISNVGTVYHPRNPESSPLWQLINNNYESFERSYEEVLEQNYGYFWHIIRRLAYQSYQHVVVVL